MSIERLLEFMGNHPTVGFIVFTEYMRYAGGVKGLSPYQATQLMNDGETLFVDVRDDSEFKKGHVLDALNIPWTNGCMSLRSTRRRRWCCTATPGCVPNALVPSSRRAVSINCITCQVDWLPGKRPLCR